MNLHFILKKVLQWNMIKDYDKSYLTIELKFVEKGTIA